MKQLSFSDMELSINRSKKTRSEIQLDKINRIVNWQDIAKLLSETDKTGKQGGRKPISALVKAKMLFVQYLYNLSDPELSEGMPFPGNPLDWQKTSYMTDYPFKGLSG